MTEEQKDKKSGGIGIFILLGCIGIGLIALGIGLFVSHENFKQNAVETEATIVEIESYYVSSGDDEELRHSVLVQFMADGEVIEGYLGAYNSFMKEGGTVTVLYDPSDPNDFRSSSAGIAPFIVCLVVGGGFAFVGFGPLIKDLFKKKKA
jgi:hypothetical protein